MSKVQANIKHASKDTKNPFFKSNYADLASVMAACREQLAEHGVAVIQGCEESDDARIHLSTLLVHSSGEWIESTLTMPVLKGTPQDYGSAMTYARRYALAAMVGVYQDDDDANAASGRSEPAKQQQAKEPEIDRMELIASMDEAVGLENLKTAFAHAWKVSKHDTTIKAHYDKLKGYMEAAQNKQEESN